MMNSLFTVGELAKLQSISRQTLLFYDKIGLFCPAYVDPNNGYRYYSSAQLDYLDTILILKKIGFSLEEIRDHMKNYNLDSSITALRRQLTVIDDQLRELQMIRSRVEQRCSQMERTRALQGSITQVTEERAEEQFILCQPVAPPYSLEEVSLATKQCFVRSFREHLPAFFQSGATVPLSRIRQGRYVEASHAFLPLERSCEGEGMVRLPAGRCVCTHHLGDYRSIGPAYERLLDYCRQHQLEIVSDSYEFAINDYLSTGREEEYVTKIMFYVA